MSRRLRRFLSAALQSLARLTVPVGSRYNTEESITGFAKACFEYALDKQW